MGEEKVRFGLIGCGGIATWYGKAIEEIDNAEIVAASDIIVEKLERYTKVFNISKKFINYKEMLDNIELDACIVATPVFAHLLIVKDAARRGINVICEKPIARNSEEVNDIINECKKNNIIFTVMTNWRYFTIFEEIKNLLNKNEIGKVLNIIIHFTSPGPEVTMPNIGDWIFDKDKAGDGVISDFGYHAIDIIRYLFDTPKAIMAEIDTLAKKGNVEDNAFIIFRNKEKQMGFLRLSWTEVGDKSSFDFGPRIQIFGIEGNIKANVLLKSIFLTKFQSEGLITKKIDSTNFRSEKLYYGHKAKLIEFVKMVLNGEELSSKYWKEIMVIPKILKKIYDSANLKREMIID